MVKVVNKTKWVYSFNEGSAKMRRLLGGKGVGLAEMTKVGLPVPPGFTITTEACKIFYSSNRQFPEDLWGQIVTHLKKLETKTQKELGNPKKPLIVSIRSGAAASMPGMMETILNVGLNDKTVKGLTRLSGDELFAQNSYQRLIKMFTETVKGQDFPQDPLEQIKLATMAVFDSWHSKKAVDYRNSENIPHDLGTAVTIQMMVFGNMGEKSGTGVAFTRNPNTGEKKLYGDYLINAQGEDVVAGIRTPEPISSLKKTSPKIYKQFQQTAEALEKHYKDAQDLEFTIEQGKLYMLQTRAAKRTAKAAIRIAVEMAEEGLISRKAALLRVTPEDIEHVLLPIFDPEDKKSAEARDNLLTIGIAASPGAAVGQVVFEADTAKILFEKKQKVILVRPETSPDDVHGMISSQGILTARGGKTSHAAVVARGMGKPAVVGAEEIKIDLEKKEMIIKQKKVKEGDWISLDGATGEVFLSIIRTVEPDISGDKWLKKLLKWADEESKLQVWANADYPKDAIKAREYGAKGIGLCRTEHMFMEKERLPIVRRMILAAPDPSKKAEYLQALKKLLVFQKKDFTGIMEAMAGLPVVIRLIDPPLHEFLPKHEELLVEVTILRRQNKKSPELAEKEKLLAAVDTLREVNPMMGLRGVRLGLIYPEIIDMQVRAIIEAALELKKKGIKVKPEIMIPLVGHVNELTLAKNHLEKTAQAVMKEKGAKVDYKFGTMIELPRAALIAGQIAPHVDFFSFGTNDLTQTTLGISRDDAEARFLKAYIEKGILSVSPFQSIDTAGVGELVRIGVKQGKAVKPDLEIGVCGEHGGDPDSIEFFQRVGFNYVSASPFRVPVARLAAAQSALKSLKV